MKRKGLLLIALITIASLAFIYAQNSSWEATVEADELYFGTSFGGQTAQEAKELIDKVKNYTDFFVIGSYDLSTNETALNEVCDYAAQANLKFIVYFDFVSRIAYPWHQTWLDTAKERWEDQFLGIYLRDEPGGKQIDTQEPIKNATDYGDAARLFVENITFSNSMIDAKSKGIATFTSDYALYWWDYLAGYDTVFVELGWKLDSTQQIALCRGAANIQGKDWGAIIVWTYYEPPYLGSAQEIYDDMVLAYRAGAKYVVVFNYPTYPENNPYGILSEEHFEAMERFWNYVNTNPRGTSESVRAEAALVLPKYYGWGMRRNEYIVQDRIWGLWYEDEMAPLILDNTNKLLKLHGLSLDIIYDDARFDYEGNYSRFIFGIQQLSKEGIDKLHCNWFWGNSYLKKYKEIV
jgi:hypothetical protein